VATPEAYRPTVVVMNRQPSRMGERPVVYTQVQADSFFWPGGPTHP